jgi:hypothetical protein
VKSRRAAIASSLICALVVTGARAGRTEESPAVAEARALYTDGLRLYRAGVYDEAIAKLQASYRLVPAPGLLYDMAQAHRLKGDCAAARDLYRAYLDKPANPEAATLARSHLAEMTCAVAAPPPPLPRPTPPKVETQTALARVDVAPPARARSRFFGRPAVMALTATAAASAVTAIVFGWRAAEAADDVSGAFQPGREWTTADMDAESRGKVSQQIGIAAAVGMVVSGGLAAWLAARNP